jgi:hypothetical protein
MLLPIEKAIGKRMRPVLWQRFKQGLNPAKCPAVSGRVRPKSLR